MSIAGNVLKNGISGLKGSNWPRKLTQRTRRRKERKVG